MTEQKPPTILFLALYGSEIPWSSGGTIAKVTHAGGEAHGLVFMKSDDDPPEAPEQRRHAYEILGMTSVRYLNIPYLGLTEDRKTILEAVRTIRETKPDIIITQDPIHSVADHDPDRRAFTNVVMEALSVCYRNFAVKECGGFEPHAWKSLYYWWAHDPNVLIDISDTFDIKMEAMEALKYQHVRTGKYFKRQPEAHLRSFLPNYDKIKDDDTAFGVEMQRHVDLTLALYGGFYLHAGALLSEPYRKEGPVVLDYLA